MKAEVKAAFDTVKADKSIKSETEEKVLARLRRYNGHGVSAIKIALPLAVCLLIAVCAGGWLYFTPTMCISIDINPSLELSVNRWDRVIGIRGFNDSGKYLGDAVDVKHMRCADAVEVLINSKEVSSYMNEEGAIEIGVAGKENAQSQRLMDDIRACTKDVEGSSCYNISTEELEKAHEAGLSCGKYRAFEELRKVAPDVTYEEVRDMSIREIREQIRSYNDKVTMSNETQPDGSHTCTAEDKECDTGQGHRYGANNKNSH